MVSEKKQTEQYSFDSL